MKWNDFYRQIVAFPLFSLSIAEQIMAQPKPQVVQQMQRWISSGQIISLRRGMYALSPTFQKVPLSPLHVANELYRPSYLSGLWALGFYGLIPERVVLFMSITTRVTRRFLNPLGEFAYSSIRQDLFRNFYKRDVDGFSVWIAEPEKALLDCWHLNPGEWHPARMEEMRFQEFGLVSGKKLLSYSHGYPPRVQKAVSVWNDMLNGQRG